MGPIWGLFWRAGRVPGAMGPVPDPALPPAARAAQRKTLGLKEFIKADRLAGLLVGIRADEQAVRAITLVQVSGATARAVAKAVGAIPEVRALHSTNGKWDMVAELHCGRLAELDQALAGLRGVRGVTNTETSILLARL